MGIKAAWQALFVKDGGTPPTASQFMVPSGVGYTSYAPRTVANVTMIGYMNNVVVYRAVSVLAQSIAGLDWQVRRRGSKQQILEKHPLKALLDQPSLKRSRSSFFEQFVSYLLIGGQNFLYPVFSGADPRPIGMYNLRPDLMMPIYGDAGELLHWQYNIQVPTQYLPDQLKITRMFHPFNELAGLSPLQVAAAVIERQNAGEEWNYNLMDNMARPSGAFVSTVDLPPLARGKLVQEIRKKYGRGKQTAGMPLLLENGLTYMQLALSPVDADWYQSDGAAGRKIAAAIGIDSVLLNDKEHSTYNNVLEAKVAMWELTGLPLLARIEDEMNLWLPKCYGDDIVVGADRKPIELLKKNRSLDTAIVVSTFNAGLASFNDCAGELILTPVGDKDDFFKMGPTVFVRRSGIGEWLDKMEERRNAPPIVGLPVNNTLAPVPPKTPPTTIVTEVGKAVQDIPQELQTLRSMFIPPFAEQVGQYFVGELQKLTAVAQDKTHMVADVVIAMQDVLAAQKYVLADVFMAQFLIVAEAACQAVGMQFGVATSIYVKDVISDVTDAVWRDVEAIQAATENDVIAASIGMTSLDALLQGVTLLYQRYADGRVQTVAENETLTALNMGSFLAASQVEMPLKKMWKTMGDRWVRDAHILAEGQQQAIAHPYEVNGQKMRYPRDASLGATPDNIVNCRCYELYTVDFTAVVK